MWEWLYAVPGYKYGGTKRLLFCINIPCRMWCLIIKINYYEGGRQPPPPEKKSMILSVARISVDKHFQANFFTKLA